MIGYSYDSWGVPVSTSGTMAETIGELDPFRYRGYFYDEEMGWYYFRSRYYDPEIGRFISPDNVEVLTITRNLYEKNLYVYCDNNPINRIYITG